MRRRILIAVSVLACLTVSPASGQELVRTLKGLEHAPYSLSFSTDSRRLAFGAFEGGLQIRDVATGASSKKSFETKGNCVISISFSPDRKMIACASVTFGIFAIPVERVPPRSRRTSGHRDWGSAFAESRT